MGIRVATGRQTARLVWSSSHLLVLSPPNAAAAAAAEDSSCSASPLHLCTVKQQQKQQRQQQRHDRLDPKPEASSPQQHTVSLVTNLSHVGNVKSRGYLLSAGIRRAVRIQLFFLILFDCFFLESFCVARESPSR